jgi:outer membrane protein TolC
MRVPAFAGVLAGCLLSGCETYSPEPVDLTAHARAFAARLPDAAEVRAFAARLQRTAEPEPGFDLADGLDLAEARIVALWFHGDLRAARLRAGIPRAGAENAGRWSDPRLVGDVARILENVVHPWLAGGALELTVPITGRPGLERELAASEHAEALVEVRLLEAEVLDRLDAAWVRWSTAGRRVALLDEVADQIAGLEATAGRLAAAHELSQLEARAFTLARVAREAERLQARAGLRAAELAVRELLGIHPGRPLVLVPTLHVDDRLGEPPARRGGPMHGPGTARARCAHGVAERRLALAIRKQWPELSLLPGFAEEDAEPRALLGFSLPLPLWDRNGREIAQARAARAAAAEALRADLERATHALARADAQVEAAREQRRFVGDELLPRTAQQLVDAQRLVELGQLDALLILDSVHRSHESKAAALAAALAEAEATIARNALAWPALTAAEPEEPR